MPKYKYLAEHELRRCTCGSKPQVKICEYYDCNDDPSGEFAYYFECPECGIRTLTSQTAYRAARDWNDGYCGKYWSGANEESEN